ncbi:hypothetical protein [Holdemanella biformis]|uniref:hypothetical protein n=1 Tax=Holdemanella biformis TaxID=1735 RepID=UPI0022E7FDDF|nr:hypothetical protein [Holdemanella biformis]
MWIRSQDLKILTEIHDLDIDGANQIWNGCSLLGKYSSEEKALEVLDEIQKVISDKRYCAIDNVTRKSYILNKGVHVYQMPQDEDVEV